MRIFAATFLVMALAAAGCGSKSSDDSGDGDDNPAVAPPASGGLPGSGSKAAPLPYPAKTVAKLKGSFATGGATVTEEAANRVIKTQIDIAAIAQSSGDPMAMMYKMQSVYTSNGWKGPEDYAEASLRVMGALAVLGHLQAVEMGTGPSDALLSSARDLIKEAKLTEADLKLAHKLQPKLQKMGRTK